MAWPRAEHIPSTLAASLGADPGQHRTRRLPRARRRLHGLPHGARRRAYAGGRALDTPFGRVLAPNITPDPDDRHRRLERGRVLARPAQRHRARRPAAVSGLPLHELHEGHARRRRRPVRLPAQPAAGAPGEPAAHCASPTTSNGRWRPGACSTSSRACSASIRRAARDWNRGAYLVEGLGHCSACHSPRNRLGASGRDLAAA
jgi:hypothetical protein